MYILSLALLFAFFIIITIDIPKIGFNLMSIQEWKETGLPNMRLNISNLEVWKNIFSSNAITIISVIMLLYSYYAYKKFEFDLNGATEIPFEVTKTESINYEHLTFLATYIISLISFDFENMRQMMVLGLLLIVMGVIYIKTDLFYANPSLSLLGFHIYRVDGSFKIGDRENIIVISRSNIEKGDKVQYIRLDDRIYYIKRINS